MLLLRGATTSKNRRLTQPKGFNTCSSCEEQRTELLPRLAPPGVSIHAPLARSNLHGRIKEMSYKGFNTCSSCEEQLVEQNVYSPFRCFNTCSSCEEQQDGVQGGFIVVVSIHAPLARSNPASGRSDDGRDVSIHAPLARSNASLIAWHTGLRVSIHAPLARSNPEATAPLA